MEKNRVPSRFTNSPIYRFTLLFHSVLLPDFPGLSAGHLALGAWCKETAGTGLGKYRGRRIPDEREHALGHGPYLPLRPVAAADPEEVQEFPGIHGHDDLGFRRIRQQIPRVLLSRFTLEPAFFEPLEDLCIVLLRLCHERLELPGERGILLYARRNDVIELLFSHVPLALLRV